MESGGGFWETSRMEGAGEKDLINCAPIANRTDADIMTFYEYKSSI